MSDSIHRLLDDAFDGVTMTPEVRDLKEEIRGNLSARVAELQANGADAAAAATAAIGELGDIHALIGSLDAEDPARSTTAKAVEAAARNRVKPKPAFVVRTVLLSLLIAAGATVAALGAVRLLALPLAIAGAVVFALAVGLVITDSLRQETSRHYPSPVARAIAWGVAGAAFALGLALATLVFVGLDVWLLVTGVTLGLGGLVGFIWLGVTQTNRTKPWALDQQRSYEAEDRFSQDPAAAARFGMFTVVIWTLAITAFIVLSITIGFVWSWLAIVGGFVVFFLVLAKMLFPANTPTK
ncbi:MAG: hypothetical protein JWP19_950 [Rhodoglobus sp.]|nr:hypothetical protein [Rhodoglobus sp.]